MKTLKAISGSLMAIVILIVSQILAQLLASFFVLLHLPVALCNVIASALYLGLAYLLLKLFAHNVLKQSITTLNIPSFNIKGKWWAVGFALPVFVAGIYFLLPGQWIRSDLSGAEAFAVVTAGIFWVGIAAAFVEEMVFRGFILNLLNQCWGKWAAVLVPSVLFGAVHIIGMDFSPFSSLLVVAAGSLVGVLFSLIAVESGSVWNSGVVHMLWNIIAGGSIFSISTAPDPYTLGTYVIEIQNFSITGGEFGVESSVISAAGYAIASLLALYWIRKKKR